MHFIKNTFAIVLALATGIQSLPMATTSDSLAVRNEDITCAGEICPFKVKSRTEDITCAGEICPFKVKSRDEDVACAGEPCAF